MERLYEAVINKIKAIKDVQEYNIARLKAINQRPKTADTKPKIRRIIMDEHTVYTSAMKIIIAANQKCIDEHDRRLAALARLKASMAEGHVPGTELACGDDK